jgi:hypothetical protein
MGLNGKNQKSVIKTLEIKEIFNVITIFFRRFIIGK